MPYSRLQALSIIFCLLQLLHLGSGVTLIVLSALKLGLGGEGQWALDVLPLRAGLGLGVTMLVGALVGGWAFLDGLGAGCRNGDVGLVLMCWGVVGTLLATMAVGSWVWFDTLRERDLFAQVWDGMSAGTKSQVSSEMKCCQGYWSCPVAQGEGSTPCVGPITGRADSILNPIFTSIYTLTSLQLALLLVSIALIIARRQQARWSRVEEKLGRKGGFV